MTNRAPLSKNKILLNSLLFISFLFAYQVSSRAFNKVEYDTIGYNSYRGIVVESNKKNPLEFASLSVNGTNISTISNSKGEFLLKVPKKLRSSSVTVSFLGYTSQIVKLSEFSKGENVITLETYVEELSEVSITVKDAPSLIREVLKRKEQNYFEDHTTMTGFYRETIKKRRSYVSLSEAIVIINKPSYMVNRNDVLQLLKSRKSSDYDKLDTIALKHQGGPHSTIHLDVMKNPELLLTEDIFENYKFTFDTSTKIDNRVIYVVNFKQKEHVENPLFFGKLYIDAQSLALTSAQFEFDLSDIEKASEFFILKKPGRVDVTPIEAKYYADYRLQDGKWYHSYSRIQLGFKVNWKKKIFNSTYHSTMELAITDWHKTEDVKSIKLRDRLRKSVIMSDEASGFADPDFWGEFNLIEPEKPIESAIKKIQKELSKIN